MHSLHCVIKKDLSRNGDNKNGSICIICCIDGVDFINIEAI